MLGDPDIAKTAATHVALWSPRAMHKLAYTRYLHLDANIQSMLLKNRSAMVEHEI